MLANILSFIGVIVSLASCYYAYKAFSSTKEISFPPVNPRNSVCLVRQFSNEAKKLEEFISKHKHKKVYLSIDLDGDNFEANKEKDGNAVWISVWTETFDSINEGERPSTFNSHGFQLTIVFNDSGYGDFSWFKGNHRLSGYFFIDDYRGPYQGMMSAVISTAKTI